MIALVAFLNIVSMANIFGHILYAQWIINNYTLTFDYGNGTVVNVTLTYNETIIYPETIQ